MGAQSRASACLHQKQSAKVDRASDLEAPRVGRDSRNDPELAGGTGCPLWSGFNLGVLQNELECC